jgi:hypothetical protein
LWVSFLKNGENLLPKNKVVSTIFDINVDLFGPLRLIEFSMFSFTHLSTTQR